MPNPSLAVQLGNPEDMRPRLPPLGCPWIEGSSTDEECHWGTCNFIYQGDRERYDIGFLIKIEFEWNDEEGPNCIENFTLSCEGYMPLEAFRDKVRLPVVLRPVISSTRDAQILPLINTDELTPITIRKNYFTLLTVNGSPTITHRPPPPDIIYKDVPNDIELPLVTRSDLRRYHINAGTFTMDIVTIYPSDPSNNSNLYAYKHHGIFPPGKDDALLAELKLLDRIHSPFILRPAFIVTDASKSKFRGYLIPFLPGGTLLHVMRELSAPLGLPAYHPPMPDNPIRQLILRPKAPLPMSSDSQSSPIAAVQLPATKLAWDIKLTWAIEAAIGVRDLHELGAYTGDIKPLNMLLDRAGHLQLIDIYPGGLTPEFAAPEVTIERRSYSEARDVFALGMSLWSIAEEIWYFGREVPSVRPELVWRNGTDSTPRWFRDMVESCLDEEASQRPTAKDILEVLRAIH
ncbi:hypothetical protein C0995_012827 [Termitomyces sp. Mi166|nr:hypothetical protein C0995_012827 [Termitomyces sp. Mi166\